MNHARSSIVNKHMKFGMGHTESSNVNEEQETWNRPRVKQCSLQFFKVFSVDCRL